jgi:hypothetical protein
MFFRIFSVLVKASPDLAFFQQKPHTEFIEALFQYPQEISVGTVLKEAK